MSSIQYNPKIVREATATLLQQIQAARAMIQEQKDAINNMVLNTVAEVSVFEISEGIVDHEAARRELWKACKSSKRDNNLECEKMEKVIFDLDIGAKLAELMLQAKINRQAKEESRAGMVENMRLFKETKAKLEMAAKAFKEVEVDE